MIYPDVITRTRSLTSGFARAIALATALLLGGAAVAVAQGTPCDDLIVPDSVVARESGFAVGFCVESDYTVARRSDRFLDGVRLAGLPDGCDFDSIVFYPYFTFPSQGAVGPYRLESWTVGEQSFTADFDDIDELVALVNGFDPEGGWVNDDITKNLVGGAEGARYGDMEILQVNTGRRRSVGPNFQAIARGTTVRVAGAGPHLYVQVDPVTGCRDTLRIFLKPSPEDIVDTVSTPLNTTSREFCVDNAALFGTPQPPEFCHGSLSGTVTAVSDFCFTYTPAPGFAGVEEVCVVVCDDTQYFGTPICQTTRFEVRTTSGSDPCTDSVFASPLDSIPDAGNPTAYCLPVAPSDFGRYAFSVDGAPYAGPTAGCSLANQFFYNYAPVFDQGNSGPYTVFSWRVDGEFFNGGFDDVPELVDFLRESDPEGDWTLDAPNLNIVGGDPRKRYGELVIVHQPTGTRSRLIPNPIESAGGTSVQLPGAGVYELRLVETATGCVSEQTLRIGTRRTVRPDLTVPVTSFGDSLFTACADLDVPGPYRLPTFCGTEGPYVATAADGSCITIDPVDGSDEGGSICVEWCSVADPADCQRVRFVITRASACPDGGPLTQDTLRLPASEGAATVCLGDGVDLSGYTITVDGVAVTPTSSPDCGTGDGTGGTQRVFAYDVTFLGDNPLRIDGWDVDGQLFTGITVADIEGLADTMSALDPSASWRYDATEAAILADTDEGNYSMLILFDLASGFAANLVLETREVRGGGGGFLPGAQITIPEPGLFEVVVTEAGSGCVDRQVIIREMDAGPTRDTLVQDVRADQLNGPYCLSTGELPSGPYELSACALPQNGQLDFVEPNCYTYTPDAGFAALDTACLVLCVEGTTVCDTTVVVFNVIDAPACAPFEALTPTAFTLASCRGTARFEFSTGSIDAANVLIRLGGMPVAAEPQLGVFGFDLPVGDYTLVAEDTITGCVSFFEIGVACDEDCSLPFVETDIRRFVNCAADADLVEVCLPTTLAALDSFSIALDGEPYTGALRQCGREGVVFELPIGLTVRNLRFSRDDSTCLQDITVELTCITASEDDIEIELDDELLYCVDVSELNGPIVSLADACPESDEMVGLEFDDVLGCVTFRGNQLGRRRLCLVACDSLGVCDTTFVNVRVVEPGAPDDLEAVDDDYSLQRDERISVNVFDNDIFTGPLTSVRITRQPARGTATLGDDGELTYVGNPGECDFADTLRYEICQANICDLATVTFRVRCGAVEVFGGFSPNGDGINDFFLIDGIEEFPESTLEIFNRWGNRVFETTGYRNDWGGTWDGDVDLVDGTYFYLLDLGGEEGVQSGWVFLWR